MFVHQLNLFSCGCVSARFTYDANFQACFKASCLIRTYLLFMK
ncbi:hypothetical protein VCHC70A1_3433 [Vibrio cholerae HC-70A1]|nr:hypothetical protein ASZ81_03598 [Vibrio cholerae]EAZ72622.1 hypothetical protein A5C_A0916 [Vibrio cholerae NCTC 8457]EGS53160.1 hypothetical protein VCHC70A1_3433 [Vibrio cholerae HC-70A1]EGS54655.1 hypothetical protein VCHC48A1_3417 [Vibrio cholerae HC-48A1]EGS54771.1 hypothetical protein VCHC40A1_3397 [Vibrio cholerae HC-40A1]EGS63780.1 hypothetical protein VCHFU02_1594 [Vibrio cholerae HFU-02]EGS67629.1 hypothetical protein VCHC38A1_3406 [Vibrio cholerae HC-38A1]EHH78336.1 hypothetic